GNLASVFSRSKDHVPGARAGGALSRAAVVESIRVLDVPWCVKLATTEDTEDTEVKTTPMLGTLAWNRYGKSEIRLVKVRRASGRAAQPHEIIDLTIDVQLEGAFDAVYTDGDNRLCLPTDTMKNTVYALARHDRLAHVE